MHQADIHVTYRAIINILFITHVGNQHYCHAINNSQHSDILTVLTDWLVNKKD